MPALAFRESPCSGVAQHRIDELDNILAGALANATYRFGLSFFGPKWSEAKLIGMAYAFEQRTRVREQRKPVFEPSTELEDVV